MRHLATAAAAAACTLVAALPAAAQPIDWCEERWVARNTIFHRAGFCFSSALGQQLFGNAGCTGTNPVLTPADREAVDAIRAQEQAAGCRVNTSRGPNASMRRMAAEMAMLVDVPAPDEFGWGCLGYRGPAMPLRAGASPAAPVIGMVEPGQFVYSQHLGRNGWTYFVASRTPGGPMVAHGWSPRGIQQGGCDQEAG